MIEKELNLTKDAELVKLIATMTEKDWQRFMKRAKELIALVAGDGT